MMQSMIRKSRVHIDEHSVEKRKESINIASYQFTISCVVQKLAYLNKNDILSLGSQSNSRRETEEYR